MSSLILKTKFPTEIKSSNDKQPILRGYFTLNYERNTHQYMEGEQLFDFKEMVKEVEDEILAANILGKQEKTYFQDNFFANLVKTYRAKDYEAFVRIAHDIKGMAMSIYASAYKDICEELKQAAKEHNEQAVREGYIKLLEHSVKIHSEILQKLREVHPEKEKYEQMQPWMPTGEALQLMEEFKKVQLEKALELESISSISRTELTIHASVDEEYKDGSFSNTGISKSTLANESGEENFDKGQLELQNIGDVKRLLELKFKNKVELQGMFVKFEKSQFEARYKRQVAIDNKIREYFDYRSDLPKDLILKCFESIPKGTLCKDVAQILIEFNKEDAKKETRFSQKNYENILVAVLNSSLPKLIEERVIKIIHDEFKEFVRNYPMLPSDILTTSREDMKLDIHSMVDEAIATSAVLTAQSSGLNVSEFASDIGLLGVLTRGSVLIIATPFASVGIWSRSDVLSRLIPFVVDLCSVKAELKSHLNSFAYKAFDIAADKYYSEIVKAIAVSK